MDIKNLVHRTYGRLTNRCVNNCKFYPSKLITDIFALLIFFVFWSFGTNTTFQASADGGTNYTVSSEAEIQNAISEINGKESGEYTVTLGSDIICESNLDISKNTVTIYGEDHTLSFFKSYIGITGNSTLNLGAPNYNKTLSIKDKPPQPPDNTTTPLISVGHPTFGGGTLNMYKGVALSGRNGTDTAGGVQLQNSKFNMYGGEISDCKSDSAGGGVLAAENSQFKMIGGTIKNCKNSSRGAGVSLFSNSKFEMTGGTIKGCSSQGSGGGVYAAGNSEFNMTGGTIEGCSSVNYGGGVYLSTNSAFKMTGGAIKECTNSYVGGAGVCVGAPGNSSMNNFEMSGGEITDCTANSSRGGLGGGVLVMNGLAEIKDGAKIYNNHAVTAGDDMFSYGLTVGRNPTNTRLKFGNVPEGLILAETDHEIDGWYVDGVADGEDTSRWDKDNFAQKHNPSPEVAIETQIALKAAHGPINYNYYNYIVKYYLDGELDEGMTRTGTSNTVHVGDIVAPDKYKINSVDYVDIVEPTSDVPGSFEVRVYCSKLPIKPSDEETDPAEESGYELQDQGEESCEHEDLYKRKTSWQVPKTGESDLELCVIFGMLFVSSVTMFIMIFERKRKVD